MLSAFGRYVTRQVIQRGSTILLSSEFILAGIAGLMFALFPPTTRIADATLGDLATGVLAYAAVAFGFCLAGMTVALTLPDRSFAQRLARPSDDAPSTKRRTSDAYSDLLFIFSWTASAHWFVVVGFFATVVACGTDRALVPDDVSTGVRVGNGLLAFILVYAVCLFLVTMLTLSQVGQAYIQDLRNRKT